MGDIFRMVLLLTCASTLVACGVKGKLKTPNQIEAQEAKKAAKQAKKQEQQETEEQQ